VISIQMHRFGRMNRPRALAVVTIIALIATILPAMTAAATAQTRSSGLRDAARRALDYLGTQQQADGSLLGSASVTEDYILGAAAADRDPNALVAPPGASVYDFLAANIAAATTHANRTGKLVQALVAGRRNPRNFAGTNVLGLLEGRGGTAGGFYDPATGSFGEPDNAAFTSANAILGLVAAHNPAYPVTRKAIAFLKGLQDTSGPGAGGWQADGVDNTNSTAMALMALATVRDHSADRAALTFLHTQQDPATGGFAFTTLGPFGSTASDPDSDALVIQGLVAARQDPDSATWTNANGNALTDILTFQDAATGGFSFARGTPPDAFTTSQIPAGLLKAPFPILPF
jgi:hypothetical protein